MTNSSNPQGVQRSDGERLAPIEEAAHRWGVSPWTVRYWIQIGKITSNKLGSRRLVPVSEINRLIEESRVPARAGKKGANRGTEVAATASECA